MKINLLSGRTHQIRKHAAAKGHPIVGDTRYGEPKHAAQLRERFGFEGMALHAACLKIVIDGVEHADHIRGLVEGEARLKLPGHVEAVILGDLIALLKGAGDALEGGSELSAVTLDCSLRRPVGACGG